MIPALQADEALKDLDVDRFIDVALYWQQWKMSSTALDRVAQAVKSKAKQRLI
jgi:LysR family transcriptional regulator (chromosome initiation inhibitor)